jgi:hypothetical protein
VGTPPFPFLPTSLFFPGSFLLVEIPFNFRSSNDAL